jgi:hypothetical protein
VTAVCSILGARTAALFCDALGEELFFRSVAYRWCAGLIHGLAEDEAHATFELLPTLAVAAAFSTKFLGWGWAACCRRSCSSSARSCPAS